MNESDLISALQLKAPVISNARVKSMRPSTGPVCTKPAGGRTGNGTVKGNAKVNGELRVQDGDEGESAPVVQDPPKPGESASGSLYDEVFHDGSAESIGDVAEASVDQLNDAAARSGDAFADLAKIEGFKPPVPRIWTPDAEPLDDLPDVGQLGSPSEEGWLSALKKVAGKVVDVAAPNVVKVALDMLPSGAKDVLGKIGGQALRYVPGAIGTAVAGPAGGVVGGFIGKVLAKAAEADLTESITTDEEAQAAELAGLLETIIGADDRVRIHNTTDVPWRTYCALRIRFPSGASGRGSGFLIGKRAVATAGHCVYNKAHGGFATSIDVIPAANGPQTPYGTLTSKSFVTTDGYKNQGLAEADIGCIFLSGDGFARQPGCLGFAALSAQELVAQPAVLAGYPGDKPFAEMWGMAGFISQVKDKVIVYSAIDTSGGQSGTALTMFKNGKRHAIAIHNYGSSGDGNSATRITPEVYDLMLKWSKA